MMRSDKDGVRLLVADDSVPASGVSGSWAFLRLVIRCLDEAGAEGGWCGRWGQA